VLSAVCKDNVYWFGTRGLIFTSPWVATPSTTRHPAVLLLTASGRPVEISVAGRVMRHEALALAPLTRRGLRALDVGLVSVHVEPDHPCFPAFCQIAGSGVQPLDRRAFARFDADLVRAYDGRLAPRAAERLFEGLVEVAAASTAPPESRRSDERAAQLRAMLRAHPSCSLRDLAADMGLSYTGASHCFSRVVGMPLRAYQQWQKCMRAAARLHEDCKLTDIALDAGFTDSAHLSRTWQRTYGLAPSYIRDSRHVRIVL
jgi:AraC-like DNA-binding protein